MDLHLTDTRVIRQKNREENRRAHTILNVMDRIEVYAAVVTGDWRLEPDLAQDRCRDHATRLVDAVTALMRRER